MAIRKLSDAVVDRIAAGEVVERPASVVKELVENAIDAGAQRIDVELKGGGRDRVRVVDDGCGMDRADAELCVERHATSKIRSDDDLVGVATLGFRGEALPSIASVSRFELVTRKADQPVGTRVVIDHGRRVSVEEAGGPPGTAITIDDLFGSVPARRKFLRAEGTEQAHCLETITRQVLIRPDIDLRVTHQGREVLRAPKAKDLASRVAALLGDRARGLIPVALDHHAAAIEGLIAPPGVDVADVAAGIYLFVNGRFVRDAILRKAVAEAYEGLLVRGRHPVVVLKVTVAPGGVDVNVHPAKTEVRFRDPFDVMHAVVAAIRAGLGERGVSGGQAGRVPAALPLWAGPSADRPAIAARAAARPSVPAHPDDDPAMVVAAPPGPTVPSAPIVAAPPRPDPVVVEEGWRTLVPLGAHDGWLVCGDQGGLAVVDRAAARAAIAGHGLRQRLADGSLAPVRLEPVVIADVGVASAERLVAADDRLRDQGVGVDRIGAGLVALTHLPIAVYDAEGVLRALAGAVDPAEAAIDALAARSSATGAVDDRGLLASLAEIGAPLRSPLVARWSTDELRARIARG